MKWMRQGRCCCYCCRIFVLLQYLSRRRVGVVPFWPLWSRPHFDRGLLCRSGLFTFVFMTRPRGSNRTELNPKTASDPQPAYVPISFRLLMNCPFCGSFSSLPPRDILFGCGFFSCVSFFFLFFGPDYCAPRFIFNCALIA